MMSPPNSKRLCIAQVLPSLTSGGVERGTLDLCAYLIQQGHQAYVISSGGPLVSELETMGAKHILLPVHSKNPFIIYRNSQKLNKIIQDYKFDLIHVRSRAPAWSCLPASRQTKTPLVSTFHGQYGHQNKLKKLYNSSMLRTDTCIAVSQFIKNHLKENYPQYAVPIKLIRRGIDLSYFSQTYTADQIERLKDQWHIDQEHKVVLLPGRITRIKGHLTLLKALTQLRSERITCLIVGDAAGKLAYHRSLLDFIEANQLSEQVKFTGNCNDMVALYALADIVISASSKPEAFGRTACEAQAMGCLVVATRHGGSLETIAPAQQPFMCDVDSSESMAKAIKLALSLCQKDKMEQKQAIIQASKAHITQNFSLERMCLETISLYNELTAITE